MNVKNREVKERDRRMRISADTRCRVKRVERKRNKEDMGRERDSNKLCQGRGQRNTNDF